MRHLHSFRRHQRQLSTLQLVLAAVTVFVAVVIGGLWGPSLVAKTRVAGGEPSSPIGKMASYRYYPDCASAHAAGVYSIARGEPGYRERLDRDGDGLACEPYVAH